MEDKGKETLTSLGGTYTEAMDRLSEIICIIEQDEPDVDLLLRLAEEAKSLIVFCKQKLLATDKQIDELISSLDEPEGIQVVTATDSSAE